MAIKKERVLLKISGESFGGEGKHGYNRDKINFICGEIASVANTHSLAIVVGGGNIIRGSELKKDVFEEDTFVADWMGMLATIQNALMLQRFLEGKHNLETRVMSALDMPELCEHYIIRKAHSNLDKGRIIILAAGTGLPNFSTDTTMVLRAHELGIKTVLKGTKVDGIYDKDPKKYDDATFLKEVSHMDFVNWRLKILDPTAVTKAEEHGIHIRVFDFFKKGNLKKVLSKSPIGSVIR